MTLSIAALCDGISILSVSGLTIKDLNEIPEAVAPRDCPIIYPKPDGFVTNFVMVRDSFGGGSTAQMTVTYDLTYRLLGAPLASGRGLFDAYNDMILIMFDFLMEVLKIGVMTGVEDITPADVTSIGPVSDPAGNMFHGADVVLHIMEFIN